MLFFCFCSNHRLLCYFQTLIMAVLTDILGPPTPTIPSSPTQSVDFGISSEELVAITKEHDLSLLQRNGGASSLQSIYSYFIWSSYSCYLYFILFLFYYLYLGQVKGVAEKLKSNLDNGVPGDETDFINRKKAFGSNTYPRKKGKNFWVSEFFLFCF